MNGFLCVLALLLTADPLSEAANCLERGDLAAALPHLQRHVASHPNDLLARGHLAELLYRLGRSAAAETAFEQFIAAMQRHQDDPSRRLLHAHSRLMELAEARGDECGVHLHRGIGLYWLASTAMETNGATEAILCRAAAELTLASHAGCPARAECYLWAVWSRLGRQQPAESSRRKARQAAAINDLTASERLWLRLNLVP